jgi:hypothetical protein
VTVTVRILQDSKRYAAAALVALVSGVAGAWASAWAAPAPALVDIRAFGDAAYIGGLATYGEPPERWVERRLQNLKALRSADVNFLNLEAALGRQCRAFVVKPFSFATGPVALSQLSAWGFNLLSLANNHTLDCVEPLATGEAARVVAQAAATSGKSIAAHGVAGSYKRLLQAPARLTVRGVRLGMVSIKAWSNGKRAAIGNLDNRAALFEMLRTSAVDVRILSLHGGVEGSRRPTEQLMDVAREFIGAYDGDIVFAHHPHRSQGVEVVTKKNGRLGVVFYSLGNFLHNGLSPSGDGMAARVMVSAQGVDPGALAVFPLSNASVRPKPTTKGELAEADGILTASNAAIAVRPIPAVLGLTPMLVTLEETQEPALGLKLVVGGEAPPALAPQSLGNPAPAKEGKDQGQKEARGKPEEVRRFPVARWIPPSGPVPPVVPVAPPSPGGAGGPGVSIGPAH